MLTQMLGWGTTYHMPIILGQTLSADLKLPLEVIFGGLSIMLLVSAALSPRIGVLIDRLGPGRFLCSGSIFAAFGLTTLAYADGLAFYALAWLMFGLALATMLGNAALVALARVAGAQARRAITIMLLFTAANPFIFYPITGYLSGAFGWRNMCLIYAAAHLIIGLPMHLWIASLKPADDSGSGAHASERDRAGSLPASERRSALILIIVAFAGQGLIGWGLSPHMINLLTGLGAPAASAIFLASLHGPSQLAGRLIDYGSGGNISPVTMGLIGAVLTPLGLIGLMYAGDSFALAVAAIAVYGMSAGLNTIIRASIPLSLFGRDAYGATLGRIALPMNAACAVAPILFAALISRVGPVASLIFGVAISAIVLAVMLTLSQRLKVLTAAGRIAPAPPRAP